MTLSPPEGKSLLMLVAIFLQCLFIIHLCMLGRPQLSCTPNLPLNSWENMSASNVFAAKLNINKALSADILSSSGPR